MGARILGEEFNLLIWSESGVLKARVIARDESKCIPTSIVMGGRTYRPYDDGNAGFFWDALRNDRGQLVGIDVHLVADRRVLRSRFVNETEGVQCEPAYSAGSSCAISFVLCECESYQYDVLEAFPYRFYREDEGDFLLWVHSWGDWGELAFDLVDSDGQGIEGS
jgi:hypothetical protein